jgi:hypothetical protein
MAKKAKQKAANKPRSFADAARGVKTPSVFAKTTCVLKIPPTYPSRRIPTTKEDNSFFLDLRATNASDNEVAEALTNIENVCGINYREDLRTLEVIFSSAEAKNSYRGKEITIEGKKSLFPVLPREQQPTLIYVRLANLPYGDETAIKEAISGHWKQYGRIVDIAPHKVYGKWLTRRWDLLLELSDSKKLEAPVAFELLDRPLVAAWPSSPPSCLVCNSAGHQAKKCPQKNPKVGGRPDPEKKDRQEKSEKGKDTETVLEVLLKPKEAKIGEETVSATVSKPASVSTSKSVEKSADSGVKGPEMQTDVVEDETAEQMEVEEMKLKPLEAKKTPRSESGKRRSKAMGVPRNYVNPTFDAEIKVVVSRDRRFCGNCGMLHETESCEEEYPYDANVAQQIIRQILSEEEEAKKKAKEAKTHAMELRKRDVALKAMASGSGEVADWCIKCRKKGHLQRECKHPDCTRCESKDHIVKFCPVGGVYATERKK